MKKHQIQLEENTRVSLVRTGGRQGPVVGRLTTDRSSVIWILIQTLGWPCSMFHLYAYRRRGSFFFGKFFWRNSCEGSPYVLRITFFSCTLTSACIWHCLNFISYFLFFIDAFLYYWIWFVYNIVRFNRNLFKVTTVYLRFSN